MVFWILLSSPKFRIPRFNDASWLCRRSSPYTWWWKGRLWTAYTCKIETSLPQPLVFPAISCRLQRSTPLRTTFPLLCLPIDGTWLHSAPSTQRKCSSKRSEPTWGINPFGLRWSLHCHLQRDVWIHMFARFARSHPRTGGEAIESAGRAMLTSANVVALYPFTSPEKGTAAQARPEMVHGWLWKKWEAGPVT